MDRTEPQGRRRGGDHAADVLQAKTLSSIEGDGGHGGERGGVAVGALGEGVRQPWEERVQSTETRD